MPDPNRIDPKTGKRYGFVPPNRNTEAETARIRKAAALTARVMQRELVAHDAAEKFMTFVKFTQPDHSDPDDVNLSTYDNQRHHDAIARVLEEVEGGRMPFLILTIPPRHGKALAVDTPIATPDGWTTMGRLRPGDTVFDEQGQPTRVTAVSPVWPNRPVFRIITDDGDEVIADAQHEWPVRLCRKRPIVTVRTSAYLAARTSPRAPMIVAAEPLNLPDRDLTIDPYVLGAWLGDGRTDSAAFCSADDEIVREIVAAEGGVLSEYASKNGVRHFRPGPHYRQGSTKADTLQGRLRALGLLGRKHIPQIYLRASAAQRLALLQGLVDTDGHVAPDGQIEFCTVLPEMAVQVRDLVATLGGKASIILGRSMLNGHDHGPKYRVMFYLADAARLSRKAVRCRQGMRGNRRYIRVEPAGFADTVCIEVEADSHLFLCGRSLLPTHNSELTSRRFPAWVIGKNPKRQVVVAAYNQNFAEDFGAEVRAIMTTPQYRQVFPEAKLRRGGTAKDRLQTDQGGLMVFVGRGGALTGRGADFLIIDDILKDADEARSPAIREEAWQWFVKVAMTRRMNSNSPVVIIMQRWHEDDLVGRLTDPSNPHFTEGLSKRFKIINLPAIAEDDDPLGREKGEPLWPVSKGQPKFGLDFLEQQRALDPSGFPALYQQQPTAVDGDLFRRENIRLYEPHELPSELTHYCTSDHAVGKDRIKHDASVLLGGGVDRSDNIWLTDCVWERWAADRIVEAMIEMARRVQPIVWGAENGHISKAIGPFLYKRMEETGVYIPIREMTPVQNKEQRAQSIMARVAMGKVYFPRRAAWTERAIDELLKFPGGRNDDFVDALSWYGIMLRSMFAPGPSQAERRRQEPKTGSYAWMKSMQKRQDRDDDRRAGGGY